MNLFFKVILVIKTIENFPTAFLDKLGLLRGYVFYKIRGKNTQLIARTGSEDMAEITVVSSGSEYPLTLLPRLKNPIVFDIGAYIGDSAIYIDSFFKSKCKIFSFEPDVENYRLCQINILLNNIHTVKLFNLGVSNKSGKKYLQRNDRHEDGYSFSSKKNRNSLACSVVSLEHMAKSLQVKRIDILKMDIEGEEYKIFKNKKSFEWIIKNVHFIFMEYHYVDANNNYSVIKNLIEKNFHILSQRNNILSLENLYWK